MKKQPKTICSRRWRSIPTTAQCLAQHGFTLEANQGQYRQALQRFERILQHHVGPRDLQARRSLSHLLLKTGQRERADAEYAHFYQRLKRQHHMQQQPSPAIRERWKKPRS